MKENFKFKEYFKPCIRFKRREHPYDIGMPFSWWTSHYDRHFLNNIYMSVMKVSLMHSIHRLKLKKL